MRGKSFFVNLLTFLRVPLIFAWLGFAIAAELRSSYACAVAACAMMLLSGLTDLYDGRLARKWNVVSPFGKMADPLMDKVFYVVAFPGLLWLVARQAESGAHAMMMLWFTILYLLRDMWVTFMRAVGAQYGANVAAMWLGKFRTALSFPTAGWIYLYLAFHPVSDSFCDCGGGAFACAWLVSCFAVEAAMLAVNAVSFVTYTKAYWPYLERAMKNER